MRIYLQGFDSVEEINAKGEFERTRYGTKFVTGSSDWICKGAVILNNFGNVTKRLNLDEFRNKLLNDFDSLFYKNGNAKFRIMDRDHGEIRMQCSPVLTKNKVSIRLGE